MGDYRTVRPAIRYDGVVMKSVFAIALATLAVFGCKPPEAAPDPADAKPVTPKPGAPGVGGVAGGTGGGGAGGAGGGVAPIGSGMAGGMTPMTGTQNLGGGSGGGIADAAKGQARRAAAAAGGGSAAQMNTDN